MTETRSFSILAIAVFLVWIIAPIAAQADAIVVSRAMFASTIAEYYVEEDHVRLELEIGGADIGAFRNLMPDGIYEDMGFGSRPFEERIKDFFQRDLAIYVKDAALDGDLLSIGPETRVSRDAVTGEALPAGQEDPEIVIAATLLYPFGEQPESLTLVAPSETGMASIGFVLYHQDVAVNDFRFLASGFTVQLDWDDPWYSAFNTRALKRQYFSPMAGFIYVEPFEVRKEIIVRPKDVQDWVDLGLEGADIITPEMQDSVKAGIVDFLDNHFPVMIDGQAVEGTIVRVNFLHRSLRSSVVVDNQEIDLLPATVGVIYVFPTDGLPQTVEMEWDLFTERMKLVPASAVDQAGPLPTFLEPDFSTLKWENFLKNPQLPALTDIRSPPSLLQRFSQWGQWLFGGAVLFFLVYLVSNWRAGRKLNRAALLSLVIVTGLTTWSVQTWRAVELNPERLQALVGDLLHNVYRAFDYRGEEAVYDVLARTVTGELLADVYLETRNGLELANQGGAQVKVKDIEMLEARLASKEGNAFTVEVRWIVAGSVGHWGHVHQRSNGYHANVTIKDIEGNWKLTGLEILQEERL
jgi:hypothetical protein